MRLAAGSRRARVLVPFLVPLLIFIRVCNHTDRRAEFPRSVHRVPFTNRENHRPSIFRRHDPLDIRIPLSLSFIVLIASILDNRRTGSLT